MSFVWTLAAFGDTLAALLLPTATTAPLYAYSCQRDYCPAGLQPVMIAECIVAALPNQALSAIRP